MHNLHYQLNKPILNIETKKIQTPAISEYH